MQSSSNAYDWSRLSPAELNGFETVNDAVGVLRDGLAAVANVETLLRSPKVGPKALERVIPGLQESRGRVTEALAALSAYLGQNETIRPALREVLACLTERRQRFGAAVDRATKGVYTARERLAFQAAVEQFRAEGRTFDELLRLLIGATHSQPMDIDLRAAIEHAFLSSQRSALLGHYDPRVAIAVSVPHSGCIVHAQLMVVMPLVVLAVAIVYRATGKNPTILAKRTGDGWVRIVVSDSTLSGEIFTLQPPIVIPPVVPCATAAARACGGVFEIGPDGRSVEMRWPSA